jgi:hypothetical protein
MSLVRERERKLDIRSGMAGFGTANQRRLSRRSDQGETRVFRPWMLAWVGGSVLGMVNGTARELLYRERVGEQAAHYISTATLLMLLSLYVAMLHRRWPIPTATEALKIGTYWLALTVAFEFGFGHYVDGKSWADLRALYDVTEGKIWILVPLFMALAPSLSQGVVRGR